MIRHISSLEISKPNRSMFCFIRSIAEDFGNGKIPLIGKLIESMFGTAANWNMGSALAIVMLLIMFITMLVSGGFKGDKTISRGNAL